MNYQKVYNQIVERAKLIENERVTLKKQGSYFERHHIVPKCLGGLNSKENLILLTAREHFLCHWLLIRIYPNDKKLIYSFWGLCNGFKSKFNQRIIPSSRIYEESKLNFIKANKGNKPSLGYSPSDATRQKMRLAKLGKKRGPHSKEHNDNISKSQLGRTVPEERKERIRQTKLGVTASQATKDKMSLVRKGKVHGPMSQSTKDKISKTKKLNAIKNNNSNLDI